MDRKLVTRLLAAVTGAILFTGVLVTGAGTPALRVEAAVTYGKVDSSLADSLRGFFKADFYRGKYADVAKSYSTSDALFSHFINYGIFEGRMANETFDPKVYIAAYSDVAAYCNGDYSKAYEHYLKSGRVEGRKLTTYEALKKSGKTIADSGSGSLKDHPAVKGYGFTNVVAWNDAWDTKVEVYKTKYGYGAYATDTKTNEQVLIASTPYYIPALSGQGDPVGVINIEVADAGGLDKDGKATNIETTYSAADIAKNVTDELSHIANGPDYSLAGYTTAESVDWMGSVATPYIVGFGFGDYNQGYVEFGTTTFSTQNQHFDNTTVGIWTNTEQPDLNSESTYIPDWLENFPDVIAEAPY